MSITPATERLRQEHRGFVTSLGYMLRLSQNNNKKVKFFKKKDFCNSTRKTTQLLGKWEKDINWHFSKGDTQNLPSHVSRCSMPLVRKHAGPEHMGGHFIPRSWLKQSETLNFDGETRAFRNCWRGAKGDSHSERTWQLLVKSPYDEAILLRSIQLHKEST